LLQANQDKINWRYLSNNPSIFEPDIAKTNENILIQTMKLDQILN